MVEEKGPFADLPGDVKKRLILIWKNMNEEDKEHFINQVTYALASWGIDEKGKELVVVIIEKLIEDGSTNLADFGLYIDWLLKEGAAELYPERKDGIKKAIEYVNEYRMKYELPNSPTRSMLI
ncbi:MAG: hypothetical protein QXS91_00920 [Candidatus Anstonellales archaeon]